MSQLHILHFRKDQKNHSLTKIAENDVLHWEVFHEKLPHNIPVRKGDIQHIHDGIHIYHQWNRPLQREYSKYTTMQRFAVAEQLMQIYRECEQQQCFIDISLENIDLNSNQNIVLRSIHFENTHKEQAQASLQQIFLLLGLKPNFSSHSVSQVEKQHAMQPNKAKNIFREKIATSWKKNHNPKVPISWKAGSQITNLETPQQTQRNVIQEHDIQEHETQSSQTYTATENEVESSLQYVSPESQTSFNTSMNTLSMQPILDRNQTHNTISNEVLMNQDQASSIELEQQEIASRLDMDEIPPMFQEQQDTSKDREDASPPSNFSFDEYNFFEEKNEDDEQTKSSEQDIFQPQDIFGGLEDSPFDDSFKMMEHSQSADPFDILELPEPHLENKLPEEINEKINEKTPFTSIDKPSIKQNFEEQKEQIEETEANPEERIGANPSNIQGSPHIDNQPSYQMPTTSNTPLWATIFIGIVTIGLWMFPSDEAVQTDNIIENEKKLSLDQPPQKANIQTKEIEQEIDSLTENLPTPSLQENNAPSKTSIEEKKTTIKKINSTKEERRKRQEQKKTTPKSKQAVTTIEKKNVSKDVSKAEVPPPSVAENVYPSETETLPKTDDRSLVNIDEKEATQENTSVENKESKPTVQDKNTNEVEFSNESRKKISQKSIDKKQDSEMTIEIILLQNLDNIMTSSSIEDVERNFVEVQKYMRQLPKHRYQEVQMLTFYKRASLRTNSIQMNVASDSQNIFELLMLWKEVERLARKYNQQDIIRESIDNQQMLEKMLP